MGAIVSPAEKAKQFPAAPGVYLMKDAQGVVLYIGKAKNLRSRAGHYFTKAGVEDKRTADLVKLIADVDFVPADSEVDAEIIASRLRAEGIPVRVRYDSQSGVPRQIAPSGLGFGPGGFRVAVPAEHAAAARELLDPPLRGVELRPAEGIELLAPLPQLERLLERRLPVLEPLHDLLELHLRLFERRLRLLAYDVTSSTRAPNPPFASVTSTRAPAETSPVVATTPPDSVRTMAYPRLSVCNGDNAASLAALFSSAAPFRSTARAGASRSRS